jgi:hypothetical protein
LPDRKALAQAFARPQIAFVFDAPRMRGGQRLPPALVRVSAQIEASRNLEQ